MKLLYTPIPPEFEVLLTRKEMEFIRGVARDWMHHVDDEDIKATATELYVSTTNMLRNRNENFDD
jgi:hypothetical protein